MYSIKYIIITLSIGCMLSAQYGGISSGQSPVDPRVMMMKNEFEKRINEWRAFIRKSGIGTSSLAEPYILNEPFRRLLELGPVALPWLFEQPRSAFLGIAIDRTLRADFRELAGLSERQALHLNEYDIIENMWKARLSFGNIFEKRMAEFRTLHPGVIGTIQMSKVNTSNEWRKLKNLGLFGIKNVIQRITKQGGDEVEWRLLVYWTHPLVMKENGMMVIQDDNAAITEKMRNREYWLAWWSENSWQFWWLR